MPMSCYKLLNFNTESIFYFEITLICESDEIMTLKWPLLSRDRSLRKREKSEHAVVLHELPPRHRQSAIKTPLVCE